MTRHVCPKCSYDDSIIEFLDDGKQTLYCESCKYPWNPTLQSNGRSNLDARTGIGEEWGVYDALIQCVDNSDQWLEYGIIEHRYKLVHPTTYAQMVRRWGHTAQSRTKYSASSFLGGCLGRLATEGVISTRRHRTTTGYWSYLPEVTHAARCPAPPEEHFLSWHDYAVGNGLDPFKWEFTRPPHS
ncbi:MAG: hypothetical protein OXF75_11415 [Acidimicrobiaceae bacterium]|nr:hypothetical protein [Acidimicrobiaceae bacterium]